MSPSDAVLMDRWRRRSDAEAFAEIVGRHAGMVYGTCHRLLGDLEAEDAAQECFIKLSQSELRHSQSIGGWLHTVAMNACRDRLRSAQRRREREAAFATMERPHEVGWDDLQLHVDEAVAALPEDLQLPIVYHFLEGRTHEEVAQTLHLTRSGVTRRIQRGVDAIRETLKTRGVIIPSAILGGMLAAHAAEAAPATVTTSLAKLALAGTGAKVSAMAGTGLAGWLTLKTVVIVAVASVAIGTGVWFVAGRTPFDPGATPATPNPPPAEPLQLTQAENPPDTDAAKEAPGIHGVVVSVDGYPRADIQFLKNYPDDLWHGPTSDVSGRFTLPVDAAGQRWMAYSHVFERAALFTVPQAPSDEPLRVVLDCGVAPFTGRVVDPKGDGVPLAHVEVRATTPGGEQYALGVYPADINGHYETQDLAVAKGLALEARVVPPGEEAPGEWSESMVLADPPRSLVFPTLTVTEATAQNIKQNQELEGWRERLESQLKEHPKSDLYGGTIQDPSGQPIVGASVEVMYSLQQGFSESAYAATGEDGRWSVWLPAELNQADLRVQHADYAGSVLVWPRENPPLERLKDGTAVTTLVPGISVSGTIRDKAGNPIADAQVLPHTSYSRNAGGPEPTANAPIEDRYSARTKPDGSFTVTGLPEGDRKLQISAEGFAPYILALDIKPNMPAANVELGEGGTIVGRIVDVEGQPIPGSFIYGSEWRLDRHYSLSLRAHADGEGRFVLHHVPMDGVIEFSFGVERGKGDRKFLSMSSDILVPRDEPYEVVMYKPPVFEGNVVDDATGAPITAFRVKTGWFEPGLGINYWNSMGRRHDISDEKGHFSVPLTGVHVNWPNDTAYLAGIEADGYVLGVTPSQRLGEKAEPSVIRLTRGEPWTGLVRDASGKPTAGAKVAWIGPNRKAFIVNGQMEAQFVASPEEIADSDADGRFALPPNAETGFLFATHETGYGWVHSSVFQRGDTIVLKPWARIEGTVYQMGRALEGAYISGDVLSLGDDEITPPIQWMLRTATHVDGRYEFAFTPSEPIRIGHMIVGDRHGEMSHTRLVQAKPGQAYTLDLGAAKGAASGHIDQGNAEALAAFREAVDKKVVIAVAERLPGKDDSLPEEYHEEYVPALDPEGGIRFEGLPAGRYRLRVEVRVPSPDMTCGVGAARWSGQQEFLIAENAPEAAQMPSVTLEPAPVPVAGAASPDLRAWTFEKKEFDLAKLRGKWVLLDFWAMWCPPCRQGLLRMKPLWEEFGATGKVAFVGVNFDAETEGAKQFAAQQRLGWTQIGAEAWGPDNVVIRDWGLSAIPSLCLIGPDGTVVARDLDLAAAEAALRKAVGSTG